LDLDLDLDLFRLDRTLFSFKQDTEVSSLTFRTGTVVWIQTNTKKQTNKQTNTHKKDSLFL
jgi:hypothetical protein